MMKLNKCNTRFNYKLNLKALNEIAEKKFLHVGYPRTGSTFLRKEVLPHLDFGIVIRVGMSGNAFHDNYYLSQDIAKTAAEKVSIIIRSQYSIIPSHYSKQYVKLYGKLSYNNYLDTIIRNDKYNYHKVIERLHHKALGVFIFEDLVSNQDKFLSEFLAFFDPSYKKTVFATTPINRRYSPLVYYGMKIRNKFNIRNKLYSKFIYQVNGLWTRIEPAFCKLTDIEYKEEYRKKIKSHYSESNDKLFLMLGQPKPAEYP